jgi:hypothetical protein
MQDSHRSQLYSTFDNDGDQRIAYRRQGEYFLNQTVCIFRQIAFV